MAPPFGPFWHVGIFPGPREMTGGCGLERHREPVFHEFFEMEDGRCVHFSAGLRSQVSQCHIASRHLACITLANESGASEWSLSVEGDESAARFPKLSIRIATPILLCSIFNVTIHASGSAGKCATVRKLSVRLSDILSLSPEEIPSPNCVKRVRQFFLLPRGWKLEGKCLS